MQLLLRAGRAPALAEQGRDSHLVVSGLTFRNDGGEERFGLGGQEVDKLPRQLEAESPPALRTGVLSLRFQVTEQWPG